MSESEYDRKLDELASGHRFVLYLEDLTTDNGGFNHKIIQYMFKQGRHDLISVFISLHGTKGVKPQLRSNAKWIFHRPLEGNTTTLQEEYFPRISPKEFPHFYSTNTDNYCCIVDDRKLAKRRKTPDGKPLYFTWKPPFPVPVSRIGSRAFWATSQVGYDPELAEKKLMESESTFLIEAQAVRNQLAANMQSVSVNPYGITEFKSAAASNKKQTASEKRKKQQQNNKEEEEEKGQKPPGPPAMTSAIRSSLQKRQQQQQQQQPLRMLTVTPELGAALFLTPGIYPFSDVVDAYWQMKNNRLVHQGLSIVSRQDAHQEFLAVNQHLLTA